MSQQTTVTATTLGGALGIIVTWILNGPVDLDVPAEVGAAISTVLTAVVGLFWPPSSEA